MFMNYVPGIELVGTIPNVIIGIAIVGFVVGIAWLWRVTRGSDVVDPDAHAERYRDRFR